MRTLGSAVKTPPTVTLLRTNASESHCHYCYAKHSLGGSAELRVHFWVKTEIMTMEEVVIMVLLREGGDVSITASPSDVEAGCRPQPPTLETIKLSKIKKI